MDRIIIRDLQARGHIGISETEREDPQELVINVSAETNTHKAAISDNINDCVNYSVMAKGILSLVDANQRKTLEALANDIAEYCLSFSLVQRVLIRVEKTSIVRFTASCGVEIERMK